MQNNILTYWDYAENDYEMLKLASQSEKPFNAVCYMAPAVCKKYLLHVISLSNFGETVLSGVTNNSLYVIRKFMEKNIPNFKCWWGSIVDLEEYSEDVENPHPKSYMVRKDDVRTCIKAIEEVRERTLEYLEHLELSGGKPVYSDSEVEKAIKDLLEFSEKNRGVVY